MSLHTRQLIASTLAVVVLAAGLVLGATPALGAYPGQNGKFVWEQWGCPSCGLVLVDRNGSRRITTSGIFGEPGAQIARDDQFAVISPDGQWVAFQRWERTPDFHAAGNPGLYVVRTDGTELRMLDANPQAASEETRPTWSRDGTKLAYSNYPAEGEVTVVDATGPPNPRIIQATAGGVDLKVAHPVWSPIDDVLAVFYVRGQSKGIGLLPADAHDASDLTPLVTSALSAYSEYSEPSWSPDGQRIAFTHRELDATIDKGTTRIDTIKRDGTDHKALIPFPQGTAQGAAYAQHPLWSPDGEWIVWKLTIETTATWEGAHPNGTARSKIDIGGTEASWGPCFANCASLLPAAATPPDQDGDGVPDASDSCPTQAGPASNAGCPVVTPPADGDGDGVPDAADSCPTQAGPASNHGCPVVPPPADSDGDGVPDASDSCPTQAGPASNHGCPVVPPPADSDGDGIPNNSDSCPTQAGPASNHGCPAAVALRDRDNDGVADSADLCPDKAAPGQLDGCPATTSGPAAGSHDTDTTAPTITVIATGHRIAATRTGVVKFKIGPASEPASGVLRLKTAAKLKTSKSGKSKIITLGSKPFQTNQGRSISVKIALKTAVLRLLREHGPLTARATITLRDGAGNTTIKTYSFIIEAPRKT